MIHVIYMAAGHSRRFGSNKLLSMWGDKPLYRHGLDTVREAIASRGDCTLTVVTCWEEIAAEVRAEGIRCVDCPDSHLGVSYTIRAGIGACQPLHKEDYLCFCVADQPALRVQSVSRLLDAAAAHPLTAGLVAGQTPGNPTLFSSVLADELCALEGDRGGRAVIRRYPQQHTAIACEECELADVDFKTS